MYRSNFVDAELKALYHQAEKERLSVGGRVETGRRCQFLKTDKNEKATNGSQLCHVEERAKKKKQETGHPPENVAQYQPLC